ncbi:MAG: PilZ domain-containing protein [Aquificota bacterium]|nr:PilZ domain-containing protein [Aquificota bacterium]
MDRRGGVEDLLGRISREREFFNSYKERFVDNFLSFLGSERSGPMNTQTLRVLIRKVYSVIFSFRSDFREEVSDLFYSLASHGVDIRGPLTKSLLRLIGDYVDYTVERGGDHRKVKDLLDLIDLIMGSVETAYSRYLRELREKAGEKKEEPVEDVTGLMDLIRNAEEVDVLTYYKEVPVVCRTKVVEVGQRDLTVERCDLNIFREGESLYLRVRDLPGAVGVRVEEVDPRSERARLKVLGLADLPQERRRFVRVVPEDPVPVFLEKDGWKATGSMADVSVGGVGVYVNDPDDLKEGDAVRVRFRLPKGEVDTPGQVRYVIRRDGVFRVGIQYDLDLKQEDVVSDYVMERQFEILRELKGL